MFSIFMLYTTCCTSDSILTQFSPFICSNTFHILRPTKAPGFVYAWLELISHRIFIARMLAHTPQQKVCTFINTLYPYLQFLDFGVMDWCRLEGLAHVRTAAHWSLQVPGTILEKCWAQQAYANPLQGTCSFFLCLFAAWRAGCLTSLNVCFCHICLLEQCIGTKLNETVQ